MSVATLEQALRAEKSPIEMLRNSKQGSFVFPDLPQEYTHWIEEQRAWRESCALFDQSYHMADVYVRGPDAFDLFVDLDIGDYDEFSVGQAKQFMPCNSDGYTIGDGILFYLAEDELLVIGAPMAPNWVQYNAETGDYDVSVERDGSSLEREGPPKTFRYQLQGPNAMAVMEKVVQGSLPDIPFFNFDELSINSQPVNALRHSMSGEAGFEIWGDYERAGDTKDAILEAGQEYGIRQLGTRAYRSSAPMSGWIELQLPAIYDGEAMAGYREWLSSESIEANCSIGGSFYSEDVTDYYLSPVDLGHKDRVDFGHDFVGKEALRDKVDNPERTKVSLFWNSDDVVDVYRSLFHEGETFKSIDLLDPIWSVAHYDEVRKDGETIGVSKWPTYNYNERAMLSLACVDVEYSEPGTETTLIWGEPNSTRPQVERHVKKEIRVTVGPSPPAGDRR